MTTTRPKLFLIDASNVFFRGYSAAPELTAPDGFPTGGLHSFFQMLHSIEGKYKPDHMLLVFDKGQSFRSEVLEEYKAHRPPKSQGFRKQWEAVLPLCEASGFPYYRKDDGFEADDVIGTLATKHKAAADVFIYSNDKDFAQLVDEHVTLLQPQKMGGLKILDVKEVDKKYGGPDKVTTYLSLVGDTSDNVPGVPGVGPGWALKYIQAFGNWEGIYTEVDLILDGKKGSIIKGKKQDSLIENKATVKQAIDLVTIVTDMDLDNDGEYSLESLTKGSIDNDKLYALSVRYGLKNIQKHHNLQPPHHPNVPSVQVVESLDAWATHKEAVTNSKSRVLYPLFSNDDVTERELLALGVSTAKEELLVVHFNSGPKAELTGLPLFDMFTEQNQYNRPLLEAVWQDVLSLDNCVSHDVKQLFSFALQEKLCNPSENFTDIMLLDYLDTRFINHRDHSLKDIAQRLAHFEISTTVDATASIEKLQNVLVGACCSIWSVLSSFTLSQEMQQVYETIEKPCVPVLAGMEQAGIQVNVEQFAEFAKGIEEQLGAINEFIESEVGHAVNVNSPKQVSALLYKERGLTPSKKTKSGGSTDSTSLQLLMEQTDDPVIPKILEYREIGKIKSTYLDALPTYVRSDGRIHTHLHQTVTATGRLSSSNPNLQNIPVRKSWGKVIRQCFVASKDKVLISADYSQIEMRILAHLCGEGVLVDAFNAGEDVHLRTATDISEEGKEATAEMRTIAKAINYGLIYGMSSYRLARELNISRDEASTYMNRYFERYPEIQNVLQSFIEFAAENGVAQTMFGRQRPVFNLDSVDKNQREAAERIALNAPVQGAAADIMKLAMCKVQVALKERFPTATMLLQVHDELVLECYPSDADAIAEMLSHEMSTVVDLKVPLVTQVMIGESWGEIH